MTARAQKSTFNISTLSRECSLNPLKGLLLHPSCPMPMPAETKLLSKTKATVASWQHQRQQ